MHSVDSKKLAQRYRSIRSSLLLPLPKESCRTLTDNEGERDSDFCWRHFSSRAKLAG